jgi:hypothetical protein
MCLGCQLQYDEQVPASFRTTLDCAASVCIIYANALMRDVSKGVLCVLHTASCILPQHMLSAIDKTSATCAAKGLQLDAIKPNAVRCLYWSIVCTLHSKLATRTALY